MKKTVGKKRKRRRCKHLVVQTHHITYMPERTVVVYRGEHFLLTKLQWRKRFSKGFVTALDEFLRLHRDGAVELSVVNNKS